MLKYVVNDLQGGSFMSWTWETPLNRKELLEVFKQFADSDNMETPRKYFNLGFCADMWEVDIKPFKHSGKYCARCNCELSSYKANRTKGYKYVCVNCDEDIFEFEAKEKTNELHSS